MSELQTNDGLGGGQIEDQSPDQQAGGQQESVDQTTNDEMYVRVPRSNYEKYAPDGDFNKVIHAAKELQELRSGGFVDMATQIREANMDGYQFLREWNAPEEQQPQDQQYQQQPHPQQQQQQPQTLAEMRAEIQAEMRQERQYERQQAEYDQQMQWARRSEVDFYHSQLDTLGYASSPERVSVAGTDIEATPLRDFVMLPAVQAMAQRIHEAGLNPNSPTFEQDRFAPLPQATIDEAARTLQPYLALLQQQAVEQIADQQAGLPNETLADGSGGRAQKAPADMTEAERRDTAFRRTKGKLQGQY